MINSLNIYSLTYDKRYKQNHPSASCDWFQICIYAPDIMNIIKCFDVKKTKDMTWCRWNGLQKSAFRQIL